MKDKSCKWADDYVMLGALAKQMGHEEVYQDAMQKAQEIIAADQEEGQ